MPRRRAVSCPQLYSRDEDGADGDNDIPIGVLVGSMFFDDDAVDYSRIHRWKGPPVSAPHLHHPHPQPQEHHHHDNHQHSHSHNQQQEKHDTLLQQQETQRRIVDDGADSRQQADNTDGLVDGNSFEDDESLGGLTRRNPSHSALQSTGFDASLYSSRLVECSICESKMPEDELEAHSTFCLAVNQYDIEIKTYIEELKTTKQPLEREFYLFARAPQQLIHAKKTKGEPAASQQFQSSLGLTNESFDSIRGLLKIAESFIRDYVLYSEEAVEECEQRVLQARDIVVELEHMKPAQPELVAICSKVLDILDKLARLRKSGHTAIQVLSASSANEFLLSSVRCTRDLSSMFPIIDDFEIVKPLSQGAFGQVYLARKKNLPTGPLYAIKVIPKIKGMERNQLSSEQKILAHTSHEFVVKLFYSFETETHVFFVMDYICGGDLLTLLLKIGAFTDEMAQFYAAEVVLALEYLHSIGIVHRDLKPDNLLVDPQGHIKLTDFGLSTTNIANFSTLVEETSVSAPATIAGSPAPSAAGSTIPASAGSLGTDAGGAQKPSVVVRGTSLRRNYHSSNGTGGNNNNGNGNGNGNINAVGTPDYIAPECLLGTGDGPALDFWALGVIIFEFITGCPPFNAPSPQLVYKNILDRRLVWPDEDDMPDVARDLIDRLLDPNPATRLGSRSIDDIKSHPFFDGIDWNSIFERPGIWVPVTASSDDTQYFDPRGTPASFAATENAKLMGGGTATAAAAAAASAAAGAGQQQQVMLPNMLLERINVRELGPRKDELTYKNLSALHARNESILKKMHK